MVTNVRDVETFKCEKVDVGGYFARMRIEFPDGVYCWYRATKDGFDNVDEIADAGEDEELEAAYQVYLKERGNEQG